MADAFNLDVLEREIQSAAAVFLNEARTSTKKTGRSKDPPPLASEDLTPDLQGTQPLPVAPVDPLAQTLRRVVPRVDLKGADASEALPSDKDDLEFSYGDIMKSAAELAEMRPELNAEFSDISGPDEPESGGEDDAELFFASDIARDPVPLDLRKRLEEQRREVWDTEQGPEPTTPDSLAADGETAKRRRRGRSVRFSLDAREPIEFLETDEELAADRAQADQGKRPQQTWMDSLREGAAETALSKDHAAARKQAKAVAEHPRQEEEEECTFQPKLAPGTYKVLGRKAQQDPVKASHRLFEEADEREVVRLCTKYHLEEAEMSKYPFRPNIDERSRRLVEQNTDYEPIHLRSSEVQRTKAMHLREKQADYGDYSFKPKIAERSEIIAKQHREKLLQQNQEDELVGANLGVGGVRRKKRRVPPVALRLEAEARAARERKEKALREREAELEAEMPFAPKLKPQRMGGRGAVLQLPFEQRQVVLEAKRKQRAAAREQRKAWEESKWHNPQLSGRTDEILRKSAKPQHRARQEESVEDRVKRLSVGDAARIEASRKAAQEEQQAQLSFRPKIDPVSRRLAESTSDVERSLNVRGQQTRQRSEQIARLRFLEQCSFQPTLVSSASTREMARMDENTGVIVQFKTARDSTEEHARRQEALEAKRVRHEAEREIREMMHCTFQPEMIARPSQSNDPVVVRGLARHLELAELAKRKKAEQAEREKKAFGKGQARSKRVGGMTIPKPFNLSKGNAQRRKKAVKAAATRMQQQCTFQPATLETARRKAIVALLEDPKAFPVAT